VGERKREGVSLCEWVGMLLCLSSFMAVLVGECVCAFLSGWVSDQCVCMCVLVGGWRRTPFLMLCEHVRRLTECKLID